MSTDSLLELADSTPSPSVATRWRDYVSHNLSAFQDALGGIPIAPGAGSMSTAEAFWLFRIVSELQPSVLVDSGSATGWSAFVMASAAPNAKIFCFDPYRIPSQLPSGACHIAADWTTFRRRVPTDTVVLFDDHINQRRRVLQARRAGLKHVLFHDVYRDPRKSNISLTFADLIGLVDRSHTFEPIWNADPMFVDTSVNPQMYRWLTWLQLAPYRRFAPRSLAISVAQRYMLRNPAANERARLNWRAR